MNTESLARPAVPPLVPLGPSVLRGNTDPAAGSPARSNPGGDLAGLTAAQRLQRLAQRLRRLERVQLHVDCCRHYARLAMDRSCFWHRWARLERAHDLLHALVVGEPQHEAGCTCPECEPDMNSDEWEDRLVDAARDEQHHERTHGPEL